MQFNHIIYKAFRYAFIHLLVFTVIMMFLGWAAYGDEASRWPIRAFYLAYYSFNLPTIWLYQPSLYSLVSLLGFSWINGFLWAVGCLTLREIFRR